jgi:hypothetical protein
MEPHWNPALEEQALDRIHRIGQTKPITTVKFIIENSFEQVSILSPFHSVTDDCQNVVSLQNRKRKLADLALSTGPLKQADLSRGCLQVCHRGPSYPQLLLRHIAVTSHSGTSSASGPVVIIFPVQNSPCSGSWRMLSRLSRPSCKTKLES